MELIVAHPLVLPDTPLSLDALEGAIHAWGLVVMQRVFAAAWAAQAYLCLPVTCPACQSDEYRRAGKKARHLETRFGPVVVRRQRVRCRCCDHRFQPADRLLSSSLRR